MYIIIIFNNSCLVIFKNVCLPKIRGIKQEKKKSYRGYIRASFYIHMVLLKKFWRDDSNYTLVNHQIQL
jgi:hypothetical protein